MWSACFCSKTSQDILIHAFSRFGRRLNAVCYLVFRRTYSRIYRNFFASDTHRRRVALLASPVALRATDAEPRINALGIHVYLVYMVLLFWCRHILSPGIKYKVLGTRETNNRWVSYLWYNTIGTWYLTVRAAKNLHYFFSAQVPVSISYRTWSYGVFDKTKTPLKSSSQRSVSKFLFLFRMFVASLLSIKRKSSIRFAWWVHISGVKYYDGKRQASYSSRFEMCLI